MAHDDLNTAGQVEDGSSELAALRQELAALRQQVQRNDAEIDALRAAAAQAARPWYREISALVAVLALLFSFGTTAVSYYMTAQQAIQSNRAELRAFLQRLSALPRENAELANYSDRLVAAQLSSMINAEATLLASQAVEVMDRLPQRYVSSNEYNLVATILISTGEFELAGRLLDRALVVARNPNDQRATLRSYGGLLIASGEIERGRAMYQQALDVSRRNPSPISYHTDWTDAYRDVVGRRRAGSKQLPRSQRTHGAGFGHCRPAESGPDDRGVAGATPASQSTRGGMPLMIAYRPAPVAPTRRSSAAWLLLLIAALLAAGVPVRPFQDAGHLAPDLAAAARPGLPLSFTPNAGQADPDVRFLAQGGAYTLALRSDGVDVRFAGGVAREAADLRVRFVGAQPAPTVEGLAPQPGVVNYFRGATRRAG